MLHDNRVLHEVLENFAQIIQLVKPVILNDCTTLTVVGYERPLDHPRAELFDAGFL